MTPNRLTYIEISVSLTVGVLLFHLYKNNYVIKIKKGQNLIVLSFVIYVNSKLEITYEEHSTHLLSEFLPMVRTGS